MAPATTPRLSAEEFLLFNELLEAEYGLSFPDHKREVLESRLRPRLEALHLSNFMEYYLTVLADGGAERRELARATTNNHTYFFRESAQFEALFEQGLSLLRSGAVLPGGLRLLCAGCSSGEEAYTLNFYAFDGRVAPHDLQVHVDAFDLDDARVTMARGGEYRERSLRHMGAERVSRYLTEVGPDRYRVHDQYRAGIRFSWGNLVVLPSFQRPLPYDAVFCRNVLIYFSPAALQRAVMNLAHVLRPGGLLFLGHSESIIGMFDCFEAVRLKDIVAYRKVVP